jgi:hypothetical protein
MVPHPRTVVPKVFSADPNGSAENTFPGDPWYISVIATLKFDVSLKIIKEL